MPVHPSLCLQYLILLFTIDTVTVFTLLLLLLFYYCHHYKTVATDKPLRASLFPGAAELTTHLLRFINILWLPLCQINKFGFYFPWRLLRSPIFVGHQDYFLAPLLGSIALFVSSLGIHIVHCNLFIMGKPHDGKCGDPGLPIRNTRYASNSRSHDQCVVNPHIRVDNRFTSSFTVPNNILTIGHMTKYDIATQGKSTIK
jgi:hypothetical protein